MQSYRHQISGIFELPADASLVKATLLKRGIPESRISVTRCFADSFGSITADQCGDVYERVIIMACIGATTGIFIASFADLLIVNFYSAPLRVSSSLLLYSGLITGLIFGIILGAIMRDDQNKNNQPSQLPAKGYQCIRMCIKRKKMKLSVISYSKDETNVIAAVMHTKAHHYCDLQLISS